MRTTTEQHRSTVKRTATLTGTAAVAASAALALGFVAAPSSADTVSPQAESSPTGWASQNGGTTGGADGDTVTVDNASDLTDAVEGEDDLTVQIDGTIDLDDMTSVGSNKTVIGLDGAEITGSGLRVNGSDNVIIRNIAFSGWDDDAVSIEEGATNVWVDHNSFTDGYDGAVDIKRESDFVTVSWNHVFGHEKSMLLGHSDSHTEDEGHLRVTYHHNFFDGSGSRHPRVRFGNPVHVFNNYYVDNAEYGVASTMGAGVLVEGNYFEGVDHPTHVGYAGSDEGAVEASDNVLDGSGEPETGGGSVSAIPYSYSLDNPDDIPSIVSGGAGPGNI